jgi:hypothetical protein
MSMKVETHTSIRPPHYRVAVPLPTFAKKTLKFSLDASHMHVRYPMGNGSKVNDRCLSVSLTIYNVASCAQLRILWLDGRLVLMWGKLPAKLIGRLVFLLKFPVTARFDLQRLLSVKHSCSLLLQLPYISPPLSTNSCLSLQQPRGLHLASGL